MREMSAAQGVTFLGRGGDEERRSSEAFVSAGVEDVLLDRPSFAKATIMVQRFLAKCFLGRLQVSPPCRNHHASNDQR